MYLKQYPHQYYGIKKFLLRDNKSHDYVIKIIIKGKKFYYYGMNKVVITIEAH